MPMPKRAYQIPRQVCSPGEISTIVDILGRTLTVDELRGGLTIAAPALPACVSATIACQDVQSKSAWYRCTKRSMSDGGDGGSPRHFSPQLPPRGSASGFSADPEDCCLDGRGVRCSCRSRPEAPKHSSCPSAQILTLGLVPTIAVHGTETNPASAAEARLRTVGLPVRWFPQDPEHSRATGDAG